MRKAGVFVRFLAFVIDAILLSFVACMILAATVAGYVTSQESSSASRLTDLSLIFLLSSLCATLFYFTYLTMEGGATVGKKIFGLKVVGKDGENTTFLRALVRTMACLLSAVLWFISLIGVLFFDGGALHDMIVGTRVVKEEA